MTTEKICPVCKHNNAASASVCSSCGGLLEGKPTDPMEVTEYFGAHPGVSAERAAAATNLALIPQDGVGIYIPDAPKTLYVRVHKELIFGRQTETVLENLLDLTEFDAFKQGISRRHAMLRPTKNGFEVIDLSSRNGTWLNGLRLIPKKPYPLDSGSQLRLGQMQLMIMFHVRGNDPQKK